MNAGIVKQDHFPAFGETIGHSRVPMVHGAGIVLVEDERYAVRLAEAAIGETNAVGLGELRRRGLVGVNRFRAGMKHLWPAMNHDRRVPVAGSVDGFAAIDVEDVTGDEPGFVRRDEHDTVSDLLGEAQPTQRNLDRKSVV